jgi:hypothetical protein
VITVVTEAERLPKIQNLWQVFAPLKTFGNYTVVSVVRLDISLFCVSVQFGLVGKGIGVSPMPALVPLYLHPRQRESNPQNV